MLTLGQLDASAFATLCKQGDLVPVWRELRGDAETPVSAFRKLPAPSHAFLLESVSGGERWGRYSFLGDSPLALLRHVGGATILEEGGRRTFVEGGSPLDAARALLSRHTPVLVPGLPRFVGGLVGYLGYGAVRWFEPRVPQRHGPDPAFPDSEWMLADRVAVFDNVTHRIKLVALAQVDRHRSAKAAHAEAVERLDELHEALSRPAPPEPAPGRATSVREGFGREAFEAAVERAREYIRAGDCMQVVLSRRVTARWRSDPFELYRALRSLSPTPYLFYLRFGDRVLAGASPEALVRVEERRVTVRPIAGTRRRGATQQEDAALEAALRADPKERAEHVMLVDLGRNDVGRVAVTGTVQVEEREVVERYSHVMHLVSQVSGELLPEHDALDVIAATFPAGTVSGAPKVRAMEIVDELEPVSRGPYAGAVGYLGFDGSLDLAIAIRTVALSGEELRLQAGAGIVQDSDPALEWEETEHKMAASLAALGVERAPAGVKQARAGVSAVRVGAKRDGTGVGRRGRRR